MTSKVASRLPEISWLKAIAILTVVLIHSNSSSELFAEQSGFRGILDHLTRFAVPAFLMVSGFLFPKSLSISNSTLLSKWTWRLWVPYIVSSLAILGLLQWFPWIEPGRVLDAEASKWQIPQWLLFGQTLGIYYFVFVLSYLHIGALGLRYLSKQAIYGVTGVSGVALILFFHTWYGLPSDPQHWVFVLFRHPGVYAFPYLLGWSLSLNYDAFKKFFSPWLCGILVILGWFLILQPLGSHWTQTGIQLQLYGIIGGLWWIGLKTSIGEHPWIQWLSQHSYGIYLWHYVFVKGGQPFYVPFSQHAMEPVLVMWFSGLSVCVVVIWSFSKILKMTLPHRSD